MTEPDIRWKQRFANYERALAQLTKFIDKGELNELEEQGLIQAFEYTHELAWNVLKDYLQYQGNQNIYGSRDATRIAFNVGLIKEGGSWMDMIKERNRTRHTYNQATAQAIAANIKGRFFDLFVKLQVKMQALQTEELQNGE